jgi:hypothetical protein
MPKQGEIVLILVPLLWSLSVQWWVGRQFWGVTIPAEPDAGKGRNDA